MAAPHDQPAFVAGPPELDESEAEFLDRARAPRRRRRRESTIKPDQPPPEFMPPWIDAGDSPPEEMAEALAGPPINELLAVPSLAVLGAVEVVAESLSGRSRVISMVNAVNLSGDLDAVTRAGLQGEVAAGG